MLRWFPRLQVATACFSCSPPDLHFLDSYFIFMYMHYKHCHRATDHLQLNIIIIIIIIIITLCFNPENRNMNLNFMKTTHVLICSIRIHQTNELRRTYRLYEYHCKIQIYKLNGPYRGSGVWSPASHCGSPVSIPGLTMWIAVNKGRFTHSMPCPCRSPAMPCR
jgi:hypothetical protein